MDFYLPLAEWSAQVLQACFAARKKADGWNSSLIISIGNEGLGSRRGVLNTVKKGGKKKRTLTATLGGHVSEENG